MIEEAYIGKDKMYFVDGKMYRTREEAVAADGGVKSTPKASKTDKVRSTAKNFAKSVQDKTPGIMRSAGNFLFPYSDSISDPDYCPTCGEKYKIKKYCKGCGDDKPKTSKEKKTEMNSRDIAYDRYTSGYRDPRDNYDRMADQILDRYSSYGDRYERK